MALALFDLDDTLLRGDCASLWGEYLTAIGWLDAARHASEDHDFLTRYHAGTLDMHAYLAYCLGVLRGRSLDEIDQVRQPFLNDIIAPRLYAAGKACLQHHQNAGDQVLIISASPDFLVRPIAERLGVNTSLSIISEIADQKFTGRTCGVLSYREGKVIRLQEWLKNQPHTLDASHFYSDSRNDLPLLETVTIPHAVNPDPVLREVAETRQWDILSWS